MAAYKDEERGTWYVSFYYEDWTGAKKRKVKRGFQLHLYIEIEEKRHNLSGVRIQGRLNGFQ